MSKPITVSGIVIFGDMIGRRLGYPTANIRCDTLPVHLTDGCYAAWITYNAKRYGGMVVIGDENRRQPGVKKLEFYLFDFSGNLYGEHLTAEIVKKVRDFRKFKSDEELSKQIAKDCVDGRIILAASKKE